jgi:hypothetical protein
MAVGGAPLAVAAAVVSIDNVWRSDALSHLAIPLPGLDLANFCKLQLG